MNVTPVVLTWAAGGIVASLLLPRLRRRRLAAVVPLAAALAALLTLGGGADLSAVAAQGGLGLGRAAGGLELVSALAVTVCLVLSPPPDSGEVIVIAACGALSALAVATGSPLLFGLCLLGGTALFGVRLVNAAPSRATLAAARVGSLGAAALVAAAPFLPVDVSSTPPRAHVAGGFLAGGVAAGFALVPLGGWVVGTARQLRGAVLAPWALLLLPALLLGTQSLQEVLPLLARSAVAGVLLPAGALSLGWAALRGLSAPDPERYPRVLLADLGLVAMGMATDQPGARLGSLVLMLTHLCLGPLLLQSPVAVLARPRRLAWLALSGVPPTPAFWGRFSIVAGLTAGLGGVPLLVTMPALGAVAVTAVHALAEAGAADPGSAGPAARAAAWLPPLAALTFGLVPTLALRALLGVG